MIDMPLGAAPGPEPAPTHRGAEEIGRTPAGPRALPALDVRPGRGLPAMADTVLPNGLRVIAARHPSIPMVELRMSVPFAGTTDAHAATAEVLATTLLREGRPEQAARRAAMDRHGVTLTAGRSSRWLHVSGSAPASALDTLLGALADALVPVAVDEEEVRRARRRMVRQISVIRAQPQVIAYEALAAHCYGEVPALREVPLPGPVEAVTAASVRALHEALVRPRGTVLVLVGDVDPERAIARVAAALRGWEDGATARPPVLAPTGAPRVALVHRAEAVQSQIKLVRPVVARTDERFPALTLASLVFGGYFSSRLVTHIREEKGLAYRADTGFQDHLDRLVMSIDVDSATEVTGRAYAEIRAELRRMAEEPPSAAEIDAAREYTIGMAMLSLASQAGFATSVVTAVSLGHEPERVVRFPELLRGVTGGQVASAARDFFDPDAFGGVIVGNTVRFGAMAEAGRPNVI